MPLHMVKDVWHLCSLIAPRTTPTTLQTLSHACGLWTAHSCTHISHVAIPRDMPMSHCCVVHQSSVRSWGRPGCPPVRPHIPSYAPSDVFQMPETCGCLAGFRVCLLLAYKCAGLSEHLLYPFGGSISLKASPLQLVITNTMTGMPHSACLIQY
jgi:hypothetical protein